ncbi:outer membrane protein assembly factor BamE [Hymenobacter sp. UYP22]|uniref:outer membrane protein assembly factor BamE domain-containing protein n=1 Tax=Hymenobacter sp. UYP22 TaxID=3156348 RepID=UPI0033956FFD
MKKIALGIWCLILVFVVYGNYDAHWSPQARQGYQNQQNIKRVAKGMSEVEVVAIMGKPDRINRIESVPQSTHYAYQMPPGSSEYCDVNFDSSGRVDWAHCTANEPQ